MNLTQALARLEVVARMWAECPPSQEERASEPVAYGYGHGSRDAADAFLGEVLAIRQEAYADPSTDEEAPAAAGTAPGRETPTNEEERPGTMLAPTTHADQPTTLPATALAGEYVVIARRLHAPDLDPEDCGDVERWEVAVHRAATDEREPITSSVVDFEAWGDRTIRLGRLDEAVETLGYMRDGAHHPIAHHPAMGADETTGLAWAAWPLPTIPAAPWRGGRSEAAWDNADDATGDLCAVHEFHVGSVAGILVAVHRVDTAHAGKATPGPVVVSIWGDGELDPTTDDAGRLAALIESAAMFARKASAA